MNLTLKREFFWARFFLSILR